MEVINVQDTSSGRAHRRFREHGQLASFEGCNADSSGAFSVLTDAEFESATDRCARCYPLETAEAVDDRLAGKAD